MTDEHSPADAPHADPIDREPDATAAATSPSPAQPGAGPVAPASEGAPADATAAPSEATAPSAAMPAPTAPVVAGAPGPGPLRRGLPPIVGYLGALILGIAIGALALTFGDRSGSPAASPSTPPTATASPDGPTAGNEIGDPAAPVTMEVWADYQCPFCRLEDLLFGGAVEREYVMQGLVRVVYRDFAFLGQESVDAAIATRCAGRQDPAAQLRFHDTLYTFQQGENQGRFVRDNLVQMAEIAGVADADAFAACLDDPAIAEAVAAETAEGRSLGVTSTPTVRLSGPGGERVLTGFSQSWPTLRDAIEDVLAPGSSPAPSASPSAAPSAEPAASPAPSASPSASPSPGG